MEPILELTKDNIQDVVDASMKQVVVLAFCSQQNPESLTLYQTLTAIAHKQNGRFVLAKVDCDKEIEITNYFQIQSMPTTLVLSEGKPIDGFAGLQEEMQISAMLDKHLPPHWQVQLSEAKTLLASQDVESALVLLKQAYTESPNAEVALVYADAHLLQGDFDSAAQLLACIGLADQDSYYQTLKAKLALALDAADSPEIRQLQQSVENDPNNMPNILLLVKALHQAKRNEEALSILFTPLSKDINADNGNVKQLFLEILTALGQGSSLANQYRRKLYTLLY